MRLETARFVSMCALSLLLACSGSGSHRKLQVGHEPGDDGGFGSESGQVGDGGIDHGGSALTVRVQDIHEMTIEVLTLACAGDCADIEAVPHGGHAPYSIKWDDGSTTAKRHVCLDADKTLTVSATDTAIDSDEFPYAAHTATTNVSADVLECIDGGEPILPGDLCLVNPSFEGTPGTNGSADGTPGGTPGSNHIAFEAEPWVECETSPDIWDENQTWGGTPGAPMASDGATYLVTYDVLGKRESTGEQLCAPLIAGHTYSFQFDIAFRSQGSFLNSAPGSVEIWAGRTSCAMDQLLFTSAIATSEWQTQCATFTAKDAFEYIRFAAAANSGISGVFVDNVVPVDHCP